MKNPQTTTPTTPLWRRVLALALLALWVMPIFGPALDHHFAERYPNHQHIYTEGAVPRHHHPYELAHTHTAAPQRATHAPTGGKTAMAALPNSGDGIIYLTPDNGTAQAPATFPVFTAGVSFIPPPQADLPWLGFGLGDLAIPPDALILPQPPPPKAA